MAYFDLNIILRRFAASFQQLRLDHRQVKNSRKQDSLSTFEREIFAWPEKNKSISEHHVVPPDEDTFEEDIVVPDEEDIVPPDQDATEDDIVPPDEDATTDIRREQSRPGVTMSGRATGEYFIWCVWTFGSEYS